MNVTVTINGRPVNLGTVVAVGFRQERVLYVLAPDRKQIAVIPQAVIAGAVVSARSGA